MKRLSKQEYNEMTEKFSPPSKVGRNCFMAFIVGGSICLLGEILKQGFLSMGLEKEIAGLAVSASLIVLSTIMTALGWYHRLACHAGAGTLVPITGFANAVVSPAIEFKCEGLITGVGTKMFIIAGPVIVYGILASEVYGILVYIIEKGWIL